MIFWHFLRPEYTRENAISAFILHPKKLYVFFIFSVVIIILGFTKKGYLVREKDISFQRGLITYKQTSVTFNRIQHVEVSQGVLAKIFKLSTIKIYM